MKAFVSVLLVAVASNTYAKSSGSTQASGSCSDCTSLIQSADCQNPLLRATIDLLWTIRANQCDKEKFICQMNPTLLRLQASDARITAALPNCGFRLLEDYISNYRMATATYIDSLVIKFSSLPSYQSDSDVSGLLETAAGYLRNPIENLAHFTETFAIVAEKLVAGETYDNDETVTQLMTDITMFEYIVKVSVTTQIKIVLFLLHFLLFIFLQFNKYYESLIDVVLLFIYPNGYGSFFTVDRY